MALSAGGCSAVRSSTGVNAPEPQLGKTGTGAITGAAVGGGLGLLVGSTSGNAGEGLLVGSLAGSALGAGIGAKLERDDKTADVNSARTRVSEQNDLIDRQNNNLNRMRGNTGTDQETLFDSSQLGEEVGVPRHAPGAGARHFTNPGAGNTALATKSGKRTGRMNEEDMLATEHTPRATLQAAPQESTKRGQLRTPSKPLTTGGVQYLNRPSGSKKATPFSAADAVLADKSGAEKTAPSSRHLQLAQADTTAAPAHAATAKLNGKSAPLSASTANQPVAVQEKSAKRTGALAPLEPVTAPNTVAPKNEDSKAAKANPPKELAPKDQADCKEAVKEAERGLHATADADRLFYLRRAARLCPSEASYHVELGKIYSGLGKNEDAKYEFRQAIDLDSNNQVARDELSIVENAGNISR